jgi:hypothetical protein
MNREKILFLLYIVVVLLLVLKVSYMGKTVTSSDIILHVVFLVVLGLLIGYFLARMTSSENFTAPINQKGGCWSGLTLSNKKGECDWRHPPCNEPLNPEVMAFSKNPELEFRQGLVEGVENRFYPSVDGTKGGKKNMFMFAHNKCSPECCPSTYSCDRGCVCTTKKQREYLASRGMPQK